MLDFLKKVFADPFGLHPTEWSAYKSLSKLDWAKILVAFYAAFSTGLTVDKVHDFVVNNQEAFGPTGALIAAVATAAWQAYRLYHKTPEKQ